MGDQARKSAEATFIADGMDYHLKVSRLISNIRETPFPDWIGWCSALEDCRAHVRDFLLFWLCRSELDERLSHNEDGLPYAEYGDPQRPREFTEEAFEAAQKLQKSGAAVARFLDNEAQVNLSECLEGVERAHSFAI
jgi:hypothetical protein